MSRPAVRFVGVAVLLLGLALAAELSPVGRTTPPGAHPPAPGLPLAALAPADSLPPAAPLGLAGEADAAPGDDSASPDSVPLVPVSRNTLAPAAPAARAPRPSPALRPDTYQVRMLVTAYCPCRDCCGPNARGITASGRNVRANGGHFVAADTRLLAFGTKVSVPGYNGGAPVPVLDRGSAIKGKRLDVYFNSHATAQKWGAQWVTVTVYRD